MQIRKLENREKIEFLLIRDLILLTFEQVDFKQDQ